MASKVVVGTAAGFVVSYGVWSFQRMIGTDKLPHTVKNPEWAAATKKLNSLKDRVAAPAIPLNPSNSFN